MFTLKCKTAQLLLILGFNLLIPFLCLANHIDNDSLSSESNWMDKTYLTDSLSMDDSVEIHKHESLLKKSLIELIDKANGTAKSKPKQSTTSKQVEKYKEFENYFIKDIKIVQLEIFGQEVSDTTHKVENVLQKLGNNSHINTYEILIRNRLTLKKGQRIEPVLLNDNERILRELSYIQDAKVQLDFTKSSGDSIDVIIYVKDKWPSAFSYEYYTAESAVIGVWNQNIFGTGHEIGLKSKYDLEKSPKYNFEGKYKIHNIYNTQISSKISYERDWDKETYGIKFDKEYLTPQTKYAGGANYYNLLQQDRSIRTADTIYKGLNSKYDYCDFWLGRSFIILQSNNFFTRTNLFINARYNEIVFSERPTLESENWYYFANRRTFLTSIGVAEQGFFKTVFVYGFGDTEDIPFGKSMNFILGEEKSDYYGTRLYFGLDLASGGYFPGIGYIYNKAQVTSFYSDDLEQGLVTYRLNYFSPLFGIKNYLFRYFVNLNFKGGFNRLDNEVFIMKKSENIRGLYNDTLIARQELSIQNELVLYSPHKIVGFRFVYFVSLDVGVFDYYHPELFKNPIYTGIGAGVRIRNNHLVFNTLQLHFFYYPKLPPGAKYDSYQLMGTSLQSPNRFSIDPPEIPEFDNRF